MSQKYFKIINKYHSSVQQKLMIATSVVLYGVPDPNGRFFPKGDGGPHVKQNPRKGVHNFL